MLRLRTLCLLPMLWVTACHCGPGAGKSHTAAQVEPSQLTFASVKLDSPPAQPEQQAIRVRNVGGLDIILTAVTLSGPAAGDFTVTPDLTGQVVSIERAIDAAVVFNPTDVGPRQATLTIDTNSQDTPHLVVQLTGDATDFVVCATQTTLDFGDVQLMGTPVPQALNVTNCGKSATTVSLGAVQGAQAGMFAVGAASLDLLPGASVAVPILFQPSQLGPATANVDVTCVGCLATSNVGLGGNGVDGALSILPSPMSFGGLVGSSYPDIATMTNTGTEAITVTDVALPGAAQFALTQGPAFPLQVLPGQAFTTTVTFTPLTAATYQGHLVATWSVADPQIAARTSFVDVIGSADFTPCNLTVVPGALNFGSQAMYSSTTQSFKLSNSGQTDCVVTQVGFGPGADPFFALAIPSQTSLSVPAAGSTTVGVVFHPTGLTATNVHTGTLSFNASDPAHPTGSVALTATAIPVPCTLTAGPNPLTFGSQQMNSSTTQQVTFHNTGQVDCSVTNLAFAAPADPFFALAGASSVTVPAGSTATAGVVFHPTGVTATNVHTGTLTFSSTDPVNPNGAIALTATAIPTPCTLSATPNPVNWGTVPVGTAVTKTLTLSNSGQVACTVSSVALGTGTDAFFSLPSSANVTVPVGGTAAINIVFNPTTGSGLTTHSGTLTFATTDPANPNMSIPLKASANATPCSLTATPNPINFGGVGSGQAVTKQLTLSNSGQSTCTVSSIALGGGTAPSFTLAPGTPSSLTVASGSNATIGVVFGPVAGATGAQTGTLTFKTTDPNHASESIPLLGTVTIYSAGWPKWHFDNFNSGQTHSDSSQLVGAVAWKFNVGLPVVGTNLESPVIDAQGNTYYLGQSGTFYSVNADGGQVWATALDAPTGDPHPSTPVVLASGVVFINSGEEQAASPDLYVINSANGGILKTLSFGVEGFSATPGFGNDGTLFQTDDDGMPNNGGGDPYDAITFQWNNATQTLTQTAQFQIQFNTLNSSTERASVVINSDNTSYWCSGNQCYGMSPPAAGFTPLPGWPVGGVLFATPDVGATTSTVTSDVAMDSSPGGYLYAYAGWYVPGSNAIGGALAALTPATGQINWVLPLPLTALAPGTSATAADYGNASPAVALDGTVYVGNGDGLHAVNGRTGVQKWLFPSANVTSAPAISGDGTIFYGAKDGSFYAINPDGTLRFKIAIGAQIASAPAIASDGTVSFVADDGFLYKIH